MEATAGGGGGTAGGSRDSKPQTWKSVDVIAATGLPREVAGLRVRKALETLGARADSAWGACMVLEGG